MAKVTREFIEKNAITTRETPCWHGHHDCTVIIATCAVQTYGGKSHRMEYDIHTGTDAVLGSARPHCGSRRIGAAAHTGAFVQSVTCGRC